MIVWGNEAYGQLPLPDLLGPIGVKLITEISVKARGDVEEATIGYGIFVIVSLVEKEDLPLESPSTRHLIPSIFPSIEHCLGKRQPRGLPTSQVWQSVLCGRHGGHSPESLVVVP